MSLESISIIDDTFDGVRHTTRVNKRALLFVHGFTGDRAATWLKQGSTQSFGALVATDPDLSDYDVYTFGYRSTLWSGSRVALLAKELRGGIEALLTRSRKDTRDYNLVIIAHSLGGLVSMKYIVDCLEEAQPPPVIGLLLYGTPTTGTNLAAMVKLIAHGVSLKVPVVGWATDLLCKFQRQLADLATASEFLTSLHDQWALRVVNGGHLKAGKNRRMWLPVRVVTGAKDFIVTEESAKGVYGSIDWRTVDFGHVDLVKPASSTDVRYYHAKSFLEMCRASHRPEIQSRVWELGQAVWQTHTGRMIASLEFQTSIHGTPRSMSSSSSTHVPNGLSPCEVACSYRTVMEADHVTVGVSFSTIGNDEVWDSKPEPAYVHELLLQSLGAEERDQVLQAMLQLMNLGDEPAWQALFPSFAISINGTRLQGGPVSGRRIQPYEWLRRTFPLPSSLVHLVGEEVDLELQYESLVPKSVSSFVFAHRWLTQGSHCRITVNGNLDYFVPTQRLAIGQRAEMSQDSSTRTHSVQFRIDDTVLPGSLFEVHWQGRKSSLGPQAEEPERAQ